MAQQNMFLHEVRNGNQPQRAASKPQVAQPPVNNGQQAGTSQNRSAHFQQAPKHYPQKTNRDDNAVSRPESRPEVQRNDGVRLFGWIGRYFQVKRTQSGVFRATFSVASPRTYKDPSGNSLKETVWQKIVVWGSPAQELEQRLQTGARVHVEGKLKTREWTDSENNLHTITELVARNVHFLDMAENGMVPEG